VRIRKKTDERANCMEALKDCPVIVDHYTQRGSVSRIRDITSLQLMIGGLFLWEKKGAARNGLIELSCC